MEDSDKMSKINNNYPKMRVIHIDSPEFSLISHKIANTSEMTPAFTDADLKFIKY